MKHSLTFAVLLAGLILPSPLNAQMRLGSRSVASTPNRMGGAFAPVRSMPTSARMGPMRPGPVRIGPTRPAPFGGRRSHIKHGTRMAGALRVLSGPSRRRAAPAGCRRGPHDGPSPRPCARVTTEATWVAGPTACAHSTSRGRATFLSCPSRHFDRDPGHAPRPQRRNEHSSFGPRTFRSDHAQYFKDPRVG